MALAIKMVASVALTPIGMAIIQSLPRKWVLVGMDIVRAVIALLLPFIDTFCQIYGATFFLQTASEIVTPTFQALIPDILKDEQDYTNALSLVRLTYDLESLVSPALARLLLIVVAFHGLCIGTALEFVLSAALIMQTMLPQEGRV